MNVERENKRLFIPGVFVLLFVLLVVYYPSLRTGFFADDYNFLEPVLRLNLGDYLIRYFDPRVQVLWYRPLQGIQILLEYKFFGANASGFHLVQIVIHWANCLILGGLIYRISSKWRLAVLSVLLYATFPVYALAVNWINITDPLMTVFYLLAFWFWWNYHRDGNRRDYAFTLAAFVLALFIKQMAVSLPIILFAFDSLVVRNRVTIQQLIRRYSMPILVLGGYLILQYSIRSTHTYASVFSYSFGVGLASILLQYASLITFPWGYFPPTDTQITEGLPFVEWGNVVWLALSLIIYLWAILRTRSGALVFLGASIFIILVPVLLFPFVELRYLYLPGMAIAILFALGVEAAIRVARQPVWIPQFAPIALALLTVGNGFSIASANAGIFEIARQRRVPFRDISLQHPTFPADTFLYFVDPVSPVYELSGMFTQRYGPGVVVGGTGQNQPNYLHSHKNAFVYYFDDSGAPRELVVGPTDSITITPALPANFDRTIALENFEIARADVKPGGVVVALFYWRAIAVVDKRYTVFVHLVDKDGKIVTGYDSQPRKGEMPTIDWPLHQLVVDAIILPIPQDVPTGEGFRLEIGLYELSTLQRLKLVDESGAFLADHLTVVPLRVAP